jgi:hypothetical protein
LTGTTLIINLVIDAFGVITVLSLFGAVIYILLK